MAVHLHFNKERYTTFEVNHRFTCFFFVGRTINATTCAAGETVVLCMPGKRTGFYGQVLEARECYPHESRFYGVMKDLYTPESLTGAKVIELWIKVIK